MTESDNRKPFKVNINNHLYKRISNHIKILKNLDNRSTSNQSWISNAIRKKIEKDLDKNIPEKKSLFMKIDPKTISEIEKRVEFIRKFHNSYSKAKWIIEAIEDQLEEEKEKVQNLIKNI